MLRLLLEVGAHVDALDCSGRSALALAAGGGYADCVRVLLSSPAAKSMLDKPGVAECIDTRGRTPLLIAAGRGHLAVRTPSLHILCMCLVTSSLIHDCGVCVVS